ncbi:MAG: hypothetical protein ACE5FU_08610 [Nitrospinota bacterium]
MTISIWPASLSILFFASILVLPLLRYFPVRQLDEGFYAYPAFLISTGEHPYRDFYLGYTPGKTYLLALLFKLFGPSLFTARWYYALVTVFLSFEIVWLTYLILHNVPLAWLSGALFLLSLFPRKELYYITAVETGMFSDRTAIALLFMITAILAARTQSLLLFFLAGTLLTLTLFFAQEAGIWAFVSSFVYFLCGTRGSALEEIPPFFAGATALLVLILLVARKLEIPVKRIFYECFKEILVLGSGSCRRPYPSLFSTLPFRLTAGDMKDFFKNRLRFFVHYLRYYLPLFVYPVALFFLISGALDGGIENRERALLLPLVYGTFSFFFLYSWPDYSHIVRALPVQIPVTPFVLLKSFEILTHNETPIYEIGFSLYTLLFFATLWLYDSFYGVQTYVAELSEKKGKVFLNENGQIYLEKKYYQKISSLLSFITEKTKPGEKIFVGPADPLLYFLAKKKSDVYLKSFLPFNPPHYQQQAVTALQNSPVKWIIYNREQDQCNFFPNGAMFPRFAPMLYSYLQNEYSKAFEVEGYDVYKIK